MTVDDAGAGGQLEGNESGSGGAPLGGAAEQPGTGGALGGAPDVEAQGGTADAGAAIGGTPQGGAPEAPSAGVGGENAGGAPSAAVVSIPGLFRTGVDDAGAALPNLSADSHWALLAPAQAALVVTFIQFDWVPASPTYRWIWQQADARPFAVTRTLRTKFTLSGVKLNTVTLSVECAADDGTSVIALNGQSLGLACGAWQALSTFTIPANNPNFVEGENTLDFTINAGGGYGGLLVTKITGTAVSL